CNSPDAREFGPFWAAWDVPRHLYHFEKDTMERLADRYGFKIQKTVPMKWDAFYVSMLSEKYRNGKNDLWNAFLNGARSNQLAKKEDQNYSSLIFILKKKNP
ncbi:MAG: methyltransferase, partial [Bacteroidota bacterium]|nr:methyltransferase [Bacteroidota bacterium]